MHVLKRSHSSFQFLSCALLLYASILQPVVCADILAIFSDIAIRNLRLVSHLNFNFAGLVFSKETEHLRKASKFVYMGHCRARKISCSWTYLLQDVEWCNFSLWYHWWRLFSKGNCFQPILFLQHSQCHYTPVVEFLIKLYLEAEQSWSVVQLKLFWQTFPLSKTLEIKAMVVIHGCHSQGMSGQMTKAWGNIFYDMFTCLSEWVWHFKQ